MNTMKNNGHKPLTVLVNSSRESRTVLSALETAGAQYEVFYRSATEHQLPAIKLRHTSLFGYDDIRQYLLPAMPQLAELYAEREESASAY